MRANTFITIVAITTLLLMTDGCAEPASEPTASDSAAADYKHINSAKVGDLTATLVSATGELRNGENDLILSFADASNKPVEVSSPSLKFHMPAMGSMPEMNSPATLTPTSKTGQYRARVKIEMTGPWEVIVAYRGPHGEAEARMSVVAK